VATKIVIDDVEYDAIEHDSEPDDMMVHLRPKRKQTGWQLPLRGGKQHIILTDETDDCWLRAGWSPFYGKVVENDGL